MKSKPRGVLIAGNWKMNSGLQQTQVFFQYIGKNPPNPETMAKLKNGEIRAALFPPYTSLSVAISQSHNLPFELSLGAQNAHWESKGAFTGEISGELLQELGVTHVIIGHSERRHILGESEHHIEKKIRHLLGLGLNVILCVGETAEERRSNQTDAVLLRQLFSALCADKEKIKPHLTGRLVIAYEPVWAIGTGVNATPEQAESAHKTIRKWIWDEFGMDAAGRTPLLYGGSVTPANFTSLLACPNVDGALVGGASLKPEDFVSLLNLADQA